MSTRQPPSGESDPADKLPPWVQQNQATFPLDSPSTSPPPDPSQPQQPHQPPQRPGQPQAPPARSPSLTEAAQTIKPSDFLTFHQAPCARTGLLTGIGAGGAVGAVRWIMGLPVPKAANWAVGAGALAALGQYEYCQWQRRQEREKMKRVVEVYQARQARERREKEEEERKRRRREAEEEEERRKVRGWWRFW